MWWPTSRHIVITTNMMIAMLRAIVIFIVVLRSVVGVVTISDLDTSEEAKEEAEGAS
jgi:hypothetical protein